MECHEEDANVGARPVSECSDILRDMATALREAGDAALGLQRSGVSRTEKTGHSDIVTEADIVSQKLAMENLARVFPNLPFAAEESDAEAMVPGVPQARIEADGSIHAEVYLALDPVDGTTNFACGGPDWGVTAAVVNRDTGPTHGVIYLPSKGVMVEAAKGHGCRVNGKVVQLRQDQAMKDCLVAAEIGEFVPDERLHRLVDLVHHSMGIRNLFSSTGNTVDLLAGIHGAWVHLNGGSVWDFAAGALAVEEAGGHACDLQGKPLKWDKLKMEAMLINSANLMGDSTEPNVYRGFGHVHLEAGTPMNGDGDLSILVADSAENAVTSNSQDTKLLMVDADTGFEPRVTLSWRDLPVTALSAMQLQYDLDLVVMAPIGTIYTMWLSGVTDDLNVNERVIVPAAAVESGMWTIAESAKEILTVDQPYSLIVTGAFVG